MVFIPTNTQIGDHVFIGPNAVLTNDRYPPMGIGGLPAQWGDIVLPNKFLNTRPVESRLS